MIILFIETLPSIHGATSASSKRNSESIFSMQKNNEVFMHHSIVNNYSIHRIKYQKKDKLNDLL
jgi:hypothetical protein